jgi:hypothetical protein
MIEIPRDFGFDATDLFADLRAEIAKLREEVDSVNELYGDYRCPTCSAPLVDIGHWDHEYGSEDVKKYACGMTVGAPNGDTPCTQSPEFPKFEDFTLTTKQDSSGWWCFALAQPRSKFGGTIMLSNAHGKTEQEAMDAVREAYLRRAAPWKG